MKIHRSVRNGGGQASVRDLVFYPFAMTIGFLGAGSVAQALGAGFLARGHAVRLSSRTPHRDDLQAWASAQNGDAAVVSFREAAEAGEILVLATAWEGTENAIHLAGAEHLTGKPVLDATNPLDFSDGTPRLAVSEPSGEIVQRWMPGARVVKVFNTVGAGLMVDPTLPGGPPTMFVAGDDTEAVAAAEGIARDMGWEPLMIGGLDRSGHLDHFAVVWILNAMRHGRSHAFKMLSGSS
ncbi:MAG: NAD(P)-binding domain-containing protein [Bacteroidota bacterium]